MDLYRALLKPCPSGKKRWLQVVAELSCAYALASASDAAAQIRDDVCFFQALRAALTKQSCRNTKTPEQVDAAIRQLVSKAITTEGQVIDVFTAAGLRTPDISILSEQFLAEVRGLKHKNVAAELLEKLLKDELKVRAKRNLVQSHVFSEKLKKTLNSYHNRVRNRLGHASFATDWDTRHLGRTPIFIARAGLRLQTSRI